MSRLVGSRSLALATVAAHLIALASCRRDDARIAERTGTTASSLAGLSAAARRGDLAARRALAESARARMPPRPQMAPADSGPLGVHRPADLDAAARRIIGFLRGEVGFDRIRLADTVTLYLGPDEGRTRSEVGRELLRRPSNWKVRSENLRFVYSFVPPKGSAELRTRVGRHVNCREYPLSWIYKDLAQFPHVGTLLVYGTESCLQTRSLTFVFDPNAKPPTLIAAVYDQFEW